MNSKEFAKEFKSSKKTEEEFQKLKEWCTENINKINLQDKDQYYLYEMAMWNLMNTKIGKWDKTDATLAVNYLAKNFASQLGIDENIAIKILDKATYEKEHKNSRAVCVNNGDNTFDIKYSPIVIENLKSNDPHQFLRGLQTLFHEVVHAAQNNEIQKKDTDKSESIKTKTTYLMALETVARKYNSTFYNKNYSHLLKENHAEKIGLEKAMETMKQYNPKFYQIYNQDAIKQRLENYDKNYYDAKTHLEDGKDIDFMLEVDSLCSLYIKENPEIEDKSYIK